MKSSTERWSEMAATFYSPNAFVHKWSTQQHRSELFQTINEKVYVSNEWLLTGLDDELSIFFLQVTVYH